MMPMGRDNRLINVVCYFMSLCGTARPATASCRSHS